MVLPVDKFMRVNQRPKGRPFSHPSFAPLDAPKTPKDEMEEYQEDLDRLTRPLRQPPPAEPKLK